MKMFLQLHALCNSSMCEFTENHREVLTTNVSGEIVTVRKWVILRDFLPDFMSGGPAADSAFLSPTSRGYGVIAADPRIKCGHLSLTSILPMIHQFRLGSTFKRKSVL